MKKALRKEVNRPSRPTESEALLLDPSDWATNNVTEGITSPCHREERANASDVAIHRRTWRFNGIATHPADARNDVRGQAGSIKALLPYSPIALLPSRAAFTMAGAGQGAPLIGLRACGHAAFTMAEILLSLTIIGVVAAITLPSLTGNINERTWNTQRKALYARFSQAIALMPALNGYGISATQEETNSKAAEVFVTEGLSKVLKINNICDSDHLADCGIPTKITTLQAHSLDFPTNLTELNARFTSAYTTNDGRFTYTPPQPDINTNVAAFETANGESIAVFYNPNCQPDMNENSHYVQPKMCANFIYDLNGNKGPNTVGKDIGFITAMYSTDPNVVMPVALTQDVGKLKLRDTDGTSPALSACLKQDPESRMPNKDELTAMFYNMKLINLSSEDYWSGQVVGKNAWGVKMPSASREVKPYSTERKVRCIKR